jgi:hypothetical protein
MSLVHIAEAHSGASLDQSTVRSLLAENGQLIDTIAEYQRMGRIEDATKYQELLHKNLTYLANLAEPSLAAALQEQQSHGSLPPEHTPSSTPQRFAATPSTSSSMSGMRPQMATYPSPHQVPTPPMINGHLSQVLQPPPPQHFGYAGEGNAVHQQPHMYSANSIPSQGHNYQHPMNSYPPTSNLKD